MKKTKKLFKKTLALLSALLIMGTSVLPQITADAAVTNGTTVSVVQQARVDGALGGYFTISGASSYGYCAQNGYSFWNHNESKSGVANIWDDATVRKLLYYAPGGPGYDGDDIATDMDDTTFAIGYMNGVCTNHTRAEARIKEVKSLADPKGKGYVAYKVDIKPDSFQDVAFLALEPKGDLTLEKSSACTNVTDGNSNYSLSDAVYEVYSNSACTKKVATLTTKANGESNTVTLDAGTYYVKEKTAPKGYKLDKEKYKVTVTSGKTATLEVEDKPYDDPIGILLSKVDSTTGKPSALGGASLKGAEYTVKYYDGYYDTEKQLSSKTPERTWVFATDEDGFTYLGNGYKVSGDALYYDAYGDTTVPLGTITIQETKAPEGYKINDTIYIRQIKMNDKMDDVVTYNEPITPEEVFRGDMSFTKVDGKTQKTMANVEFKLTQVKTGESHILITDEKGRASTASDWNLHSNHTNRGDRSSDGIWFGEDADGNVAPVDDTVGALPFGTYTLEELRCEANEGYDLFEAITFTVGSDKQLVDLGNLVNNFVELSTTALDGETNTHVSNADGSVKIVDTVSFEGLTPGKTYKLVGRAYDKNTKTALVLDGKEVEVETTFVPTESVGTTNVEFSLNATSLAGKTIVFAETLYRDGIFIQEHFDLEDEAQTIYFPEVKTNAKDKETGHQVVKAEGTVVISDKVSYSNLLRGRYVVRGILMDADTGEKLLVNGEEVSQMLSFVSDGEDDFQTLEFTLDASDMKGKKVTVFERIYDRNGNVVATHEVLNAESQTVYFPKVRTHAADEKSESDIAVSEDAIVITDTVSYESLLVGKEYTIKGTLMNKETGEPLLSNGEKITATKTFTATTEDGRVALEFKANKSVAGKIAVAYEEVYLENTLIAEHKDLKDEAQTVYIPNLATKAYEKETGSNNPVVKEQNVIVDEATYTGIPAGRTYTVKGYLMDKETGNFFLVNDQKVEAETTFTTTETTGTVTLEFAVSGDLVGGKELVVFEELYLDGRLIADHKDINAEEQTVKFDFTPVTVNKTDLATGAYVKDAVMQLISLEVDEENSTPEETIYKETIVEAWKTGEEAYLCLNVKPGLYLIREEKTPGGYVTAEDFMFEKVTAYEELEYTIEDDITKVEFSKKDATDLAEVVGAKLQVVAEDGTVAYEWVTDGKPHYMEYIPVGDYTLVEAETPYGYVKAADVPFTVEDTGEIQYVEMLDERVQGYIEIEKVSSVNRTPLAGAEFELRDSEGKVLETLVTDEEGKVTSAKMDIGIFENGVCTGTAVYILQETVAPEGFQLDDAEYEVSFEYLGEDVPVVSKTYKIPNAMIEKEEPIPVWQRIPTGDTADVLMWVLIAAGALFLIFANKKKKNKKDDDK